MGFIETYDALTKRGQYIIYTWGKRIGSFARVDHSESGGSYSSGMYTTVVLDNGHRSKYDDLQGICVPISSMEG